jgi:hypothetical protein
VALEKVHKSRNDVDGPKWECELGEIDYDDWAQLLASGEDIAFATDLIADNPVDRFESFWIDTKPMPEAAVQNGIALTAATRPPAW